MSNFFRKKILKDIFLILIYMKFCIFRCQICYFYRFNVESTVLIDAHLESKKRGNINEIAEIKKCLYVDDFISGGINTTVVKRLKQLIINIFGEAQFILHKWHSNVPELDDDNNSEKIQTYVKVQLGLERNQTKILALT